VIKNNNHHYFYNNNNDNNRISRVTDDPRETLFLFQHISVAIRRFNAVIFFQILSATPMTTPQAFRSTPIYKEFNFVKQFA